VFGACNDNPVILNLHELRERMVRDQIAARGVRDPLVLEAMRAVSREKFVALGSSQRAYEDRPLPIGSGQTISQPYIVAFMVAALDLKAGTKVLEIGAGSGYAAAVLAQIADQVFAVERIGQLAERARQNLQDADCTNVQIRHADGTQGWLEEAPFDAILVSAGAPNVPEALLDQLKVGGRMVIPIGQTPGAQKLIRITRRRQDSYERKALADVRFVPLVGDGVRELEG